MGQHCGILIFATLGSAFQQEKECHRKQAAQARRWSSTASDISAIHSPRSQRLRSTLQRQARQQYLKDQPLASVQSRAGSAARAQAACTPLSQSSESGPTGHSPPSRAGDAFCQAAPMNGRSNKICQCFVGCLTSVRESREVLY